MVNAVQPPVDRTPSVVCCVSTYNHLHHALVMVRSIRQTWDEQPDILILLLDQPQLPHPGFEDLPHVRFASPDDLAIPDFVWLATKFSAYELACACKPLVLQFAFKLEYNLAWYIDADMLFFSDPAPMRILAGMHDVVVTPHFFSPLPEQEAWLRPTIGHIADAGILNAGLFTLRRGEASDRFLEQWSTMTLGPGACLKELGNTQEQHVFNWVPAFVADVAFCRDPRLNIAYWNLHERPLRWAHLDGGAKTQWRLDGKVICCFHFSGFRWEERRLSRHDERHHLHLNINLHHLAAHYQACLESANLAHYASNAWPFEKIGALTLNDDIRRYLKRLEARGKPDWNPDAANHTTEVVDTLLSMPGKSTLLPAMLEEILVQRPDLQSLHKREALYLGEFLAWCRQFLELEYGGRVPVFQSRLLAIHRPSLETLTRQCAKFLPRESITSLTDALVQGRQQLLAKLGQHPHANRLAKNIAAGRYLVIATNPVTALRILMAQWPALFRNVPPPGRGDIRVFRARVLAVLSRHFIWPAAHDGFLERLDPAISLTRVFAFCRRVPPFLAELRRHGLSREILAALIPWMANSVEFDGTDLALIDWVVHRHTPAPAAHAPGKLQRLSGMARAATALLAPRRPDLLAPRLTPFLIDDRHPLHWHGYLAWWARKNGIPTSGRARAAEALAALDRLLTSVAWDGLNKTFPSLAPEVNGLNIFGYFKSPIGLGQMTRGVASAHNANGNPHREIVLTNLSMNADLRLEDLYPDFAFHFPRSLAVTYPHIDHDLADIFPSCFFRGRETIAYVAWEQRDLHPEWCKRLAPYDRLFALSRFTAESVARATGRNCHALPCVVDVDVASARAWRRSDFGLLPDAFVAGFIFDASSSIPRKNPLAAARALIRAFRGRPDVQIVIKVNNGHRPEFRHVVDALVALLAEAGLAHRVIAHILPRPELEGLIAQFDLYISLHRCEGFGYTIAEAMWLGVPVVATAYSGNMDFMNQTNAYPVRFQECLVRENDGPFQIGTVWADPDVDHAAALCDQIYHDRDAARAKAVIAERDIRATVSVPAVAARLRELLG